MNFKFTFSSQEWWIQTGSQSLTCALWHVYWLMIIFSIYCVNNWANPRLDRCNWPIKHINIGTFCVHSVPLFPRWSSWGSTSTFSHLCTCRTDAVTFTPLHKELLTKTLCAPESWNWMLSSGRGSAATHPHNGPCVHLSFLSHQQLRGGATPEPSANTVHTRWWQQALGNRAAGHGD